MTKIVQHSFLGGQLDWEMMGRQDVTKYRNGATLLKNVVLHKRGAAFKRPGTNLVQSVTNSVVADKARLVPFASTTSQGWALLFTSGAIYAVNSSLGMTEVQQPTGSPYSQYTDDEVYELDYCQCGDVLYIAHRGHPPCMVTHTVSGDGSTLGQHTFKISVVDLNMQKRGIPNITSSTVSKLGVTTRGPSFTEHYKVTAVYDGVETFPSDDYFNENVKDYDCSYADTQRRNEEAAAQGQPASAVWIASTFTYAGTSYTLPWTESQKIALKINVPTRSDGKRPEQIRIYRKTGSFYGLVGLVNGERGTTAPDVVSSSLDDLPGQLTNNVVTIPYKTQVSAWDGVPSPSEKGNALNAATLDAKTFGIGVDGFRVTGPLHLRLDEPARNRVVVVMRLGHISYEQRTGNAAFPNYDSTKTYNADDFARYPNYASGNSKKYRCRTNGVTKEFNAALWESMQTSMSAVSRVYTYTPCGVSSFKVRFGDGEEKTVECITSSEEASFNVNQPKGETADRFIDAADDRAADKFSKLGIVDQETLVVEVESVTAARLVTITPLDEDGNVLSSADWVVTNVVASENMPGEFVAVPRTVTWEDRYFTPDVSITPPSDAGVMAKANDYPGCVCLSQQRLIWASTNNDPSRVFMSEIGAFYTYSPHDVQTADDPIDFQVSATQFPRVYHIAELRKIILFNGASEWIVDSASSNSGITFETIRATQHSCIGSATSLKPVVCNNVLLFAELTGQAVRQYGYELEDDGYGGSDISVFAQSIFNEKKIVAWAYQQHPHSTCWCVLSDGTLASLTFNREQQCIAWATHELGRFGNDDTRVLDIVCTQALVGNDPDVKDTSEMLLLVRRGSGYYLEQFRPEPKDASDAVANYVCMDCMRTLSAGDTRRGGSTMVDLDTMQTATTVQSGHSYVDGAPFDMRITTVYPVVAEAVGMSQMDVKNVQYVGLRLMRSVGGRVKSVDAPDANSVPLVKTGTSVPVNGVATLPAIDERVLLPASENRDGRVTIYQDEPFTFGVVMVETDVETEESR